MPNYEFIKKLEPNQLEKLYNWGMQRQLRWAVFTVTFLVALLTIYVKLNEIVNLNTLTLTIQTFKNNEFWALIIILIPIFYGLWICVGQLVDYYEYVARIENNLVKTEQWKIKLPENKEDLKRDDVFFVNNTLERLLNGSENSKNTFRLLLVTIAIGSFLVPKLVQLIVYSLTLQ